jgi:hypothetical protein
MTKPWIMDSRTRASKKYLELHDQLRREVEDSKRSKIKTGKPLRKYARHELFRLTADQ